tara:strand:+ start:297 stop:611 length:315 start_codon:yes stop_codon:yes gene_type:complete
MEITKNQIIDVLNLMMMRLDSLENEQAKQKDYIVQIKKRMIQLNNFINDIIDIVEDERYTEEEAYAETMKIYDQMKKKVNEMLNDSELKDINKKELLSNIVGES